MIFDNQHEIQRLESIDELRNLGINPYPHFLRRDMNISKFRLKFNYIKDVSFDTSFILFQIIWYTIIV